MKLIDADAMWERNRSSIYDTSDLKEMLDYEPTAVEMNMILEQLEDYGKYKGLLKVDDNGCENYIPVSIAKQIVKGKGLGGVLGYMTENNNNEVQKSCSTCKNNIEYPPPHTCDICTSLDQEEEYEM